MIYPMLSGPTQIEPGAAITMDAVSSFDDAVPGEALTFEWSHATGAGKVVPTDTESSGHRASYTISSSATVGDTLTVKVRATSSTGTSDWATRDLTVVERLSYPTLSLESDLPDELIIMPRSDWQFDLKLRAGDGTAANPNLALAVDPHRMLFALEVQGQRAALPVSVERLGPDWWRCRVRGVPANELVAEHRVESAFVTMVEGTNIPLIHLLFPAEQVRSILWLRENTEPEVIEAPFWSHEMGSLSIQLHDSLAGAVRERELYYVEVDYYSLDRSYQAGWFAQLGMEPFDMVQGSLTISYAADVELVSQTRLPIQLEVAPVWIAGSVRALARHDVWMRNQTQALLRENYQGVMLI